MNKQKMIIVFSFLLIVSTLLFSQSVFAKENKGNVNLVEDGKAESAIIWWSKDNSDSSVPKFAATELQSYLSKMSGATVPVLKGTMNDDSNLHPNKLSSAVVIVTGEQAKEYLGKSQAKIPGGWLVSTAKKLENTKDDSFAINTEGDRIILAGSNKRGTLYAGYRLLKELGVQFMAPDFDYYQENSEIIPSKKTVSVSHLNILEEPDMKFRRKYMEEGWSFNQSNLKDLVDWMAKHNLNILNSPSDYYGDHTMKWDDFRDQIAPELKKRGIMAEVGGHGFESYLPKEKYQKTHPEWFVNGYNVFNIANEDAVEEYVDQVVTYLKKRPEIKIFDAWPPDGASWPPKVVNKFGSTTNAYAYVVNKLTEAVNEELPGVRIEAIAYSNHIDPPDAKYMFHDSTIIDFAPISRSQTVPIYHKDNEYYVNLINKWRKVYDGDFAIYTYYRRYSFHSVPVVLGNLIGNDIPYYKELGANGIGLYSEPADWIPFELSHLMIADMSWDTSINPDQYIQKYIQNRYGKTADEMASYFRLVEDAGRIIYDQPFTNYNELDDVTKAREKYVQAKEMIAAAKKKDLGSSQAGFMLQRLDSNLDYTIADIDYSYYKLQNDKMNMEKSMKKAMELVRKHRFDGIILQNMYLMRRYKDGVTRENTLWLYDMYRGKSAVDISLSLPDFISKGESFEVDATIRNYSKKALDAVALKLDVPNDWTVKPVSNSEFENIPADPENAHIVTWKVTVPENSDLGTYHLNAYMNFNYDGKAESNKMKKSLSIAMHHPMTTMGTYPGYALENMVDDNPSTYYWTNEGPNESDWIGVDLGSVKNIDHMEILMASDTKAEDYIHDGAIEISTDRENWKTIKEVHGQSNVSLDVPAQTNARYVRIRSTKNQSKWVQVREFKVDASKLTINEMKKLVNQYSNAGKIKNEKDVHLLQLHLTSLGHFVKNDSSKKVVEHTNGLIQLVKRYKEDDRMDHDAANSFMKYAADFMKNWK